MIIAQDLNPTVPPETAKSTKLIDPNIEKGEAKQAVGIPHPCLLLGNPAEGTWLLCAAAFQKKCWFVNQWMHEPASPPLPLTRDTALMSKIIQS